MEVQAPDNFTLSVEFISLCDNLTVTWQLKGKIITNDTNYMTTIHIVKRFRYKTSLIVKLSSESDNGTYTVTVASATGSVSVNITVKVKKSELHYTSDLINSSVSQLNLV